MIIENRSRSNKLYGKVYLLWYNMNSRCYNKEHPRYKDYGGKGVYVSDRWKNLNYFIEDLDRIDGFDLKKYLSGDLALDKDLKDRNNLEYSLENCSFVSMQENNKVKPNQQLKFLATNPDGDTFECFNQSEMARKHNLSQSKISECLKGKRKTHKDWIFKCI